MNIKDKQCESCQHFGKGECDYVNCYKTNWSYWEIINKPRPMTEEMKKKVIDKINIKDWEKDWKELLNLNLNNNNYEDNAIYLKVKSMGIFFINRLLAQSNQEIVKEILDRVEDCIYKDTDGIHAVIVERIDRQKLTQLRQSNKLLIKTRRLK